MKQITPGTPRWRWTRVIRFIPHPSTLNPPLRVCGGAAIAPGCNPGAFGLRRFESCRTHLFREHVADGRRPSCNLGSSRFDSWRALGKENRDARSEKEDDRPTEALTLLARGLVSKTRGPLVGPGRFDSCSFRFSLARRDAGHRRPSDRAPARNTPR